MKLFIKNLQKKIPVSRPKIKQAVLKVLSREISVKAGEINISFISDSKIRKLNALYHNRNYPTDVLAFDLSVDKKNLIVDIYISADTAVKNSRIFRTEPKTELYLYVIHAMLHIAGYDDHSLKETSLMRKKEDTYLKWLLSKPKQ
ncbi:MAG: rRNA maturation RNase YbeY [Candidatus Omnitrophica bacterium]|nr:rRNA maturation RNase YbeY [Candidatus Omnitrophota bacterium]